MSNGVGTFTNDCYEPESIPVTTAFSFREWEENSEQKRGKQPEKDADYLRVGEQRLFPSWERSVDGVTEYAAARPQHEQADTEEKARFGQQSVIEIAVSSHA